MSRTSTTGSNSNDGIPTDYGDLAITRFSLGFHRFVGISNYLIACGKPAGHSHLVHRDILMSLRRIRRPWPGQKQGQCVCVCKKASVRQSCGV